MNDTESMEEGDGLGIGEETNMNNTKSIKAQENNLLERIYDQGQAEKFNDLIKNPTKIKAVKAFITDDDIENMINLPPDKTKTGFKEGVQSGGMNGTSNHVSGNMQDLLSITGFKIIDKLPPTIGDPKNKTNSMIDRFRVTFNDFDGNHKMMGTTKSRWTNDTNLEPKLSRPTTTIINLGKKYNMKKEETKTEEIKDENINEIEKINYENENPLEQLNKEIDESDQDEYMNLIHKFLRDAFKGRDHKMDFVYFLPSNNENYYKLTPKTFNDIADKKTYYTLSSKGLTVYIDKKPREFIKLAEWMNERQRYDVIAEIPFFKNFKIWRIITMWRKNIFKQKKIAYQNELQNSLLFNNEDYNTRLIEHKKFCNEILFLKVVDMKVGLDSNSFKKFQDMQIELRKRTKRKLDEIHTKCQNNFDTSLKSIFSKVYQKINDLHNEQNHNVDDKKQGQGAKKDKRRDKTEDKNEEKIDKGSTTDNKTMVNEDEIVGFENYAYKNKMLVKDECKNFVKLAYLFDYIMLDLLRRMFIFSITDVLTKLDEYNSQPIPPKKENILNKNGEYIKPQNMNPNRVVPYFMVQCKLDDKPIEKVDYIKKKVKPFYVKATPDAEFDPTAHIQIDYEEMEYQKQLQAGKTQKEIISGGDLLAASDDIEIKEIKRPHHYFIKYEPDCETLKVQFKKEIKDTLEILKVKGWRAHPRFSSYLRYMDDWDEKYADWEAAAEPKELNVEEILKEDNIFQTKDTEIENKIKYAYDKCDNYLERLDPYLQYHWKQKSINKNILLDEYLKDSDEIFRLIFVYSENAKKVIERYIPFDEEIGMIKLNLEEGLRQELRTAQNSVIDFLKLKYPDKLHSRAQETDAWIDDMFIKISGDIIDERSFLEKTKAKDVLDIWYDINERKLNSMFTIVNILKNKGFEKITNEDVKMFEMLNSKKFQLKTTWDTLNDNLNKSQDKLYNSLEKDSIPKLNKNTQQILEPLKDPKFITFDNSKNAEENNIIIQSNIDELERADKEFKKIEQNAETYNDFLRVLGQPEHNFSKVYEVREIIDILKNLWKALLSFGVDCNEWKKTEFSHLDTKDILDKCSNYETIGRRAAANLGDNGSAIQELITQVESFSESMRVVDYLKCPDLTNEHWQRIQSLFPEETFALQGQAYTLEQLLSIKAYQFEKQIREIQLEAINYRNLDLKIQKIILARKDITIKVNLEKKTIDNYPAMIKDLEECQSQINNVVSSKYAKLFTKPEKNPFIIKQDLERYLNAIDFLKSFQKKFKYLENIIYSGDMKRTLQDSSFDKVDIDWKGALNKIGQGAISRVIDLQVSMGPKAKILDQIQHKIEEQLMQMRIQFERFFFISNDDLLYMLANSKNSENKSGVDGFEQIKPYLSKIFEDVYELNYIQTLGTSGKEIVAVISLSKEKLKFQKGVKVDDDLARWIGQLETKINETMKERMLQAYKSYEDIKDETKHEIWITYGSLDDNTQDNKHQKKEDEEKQLNLSQVVTTISHVKFCDDTETSIKELSKESNALIIWYSRIEKAILSYSKMVNKVYEGELRNVRRTISNLITHHVHFKDILGSLIESELEYEDDFVWQKQLRTYFLSTDPLSRDERNLMVKIKQLKYEFDYGYEYFGPSTRIVISPLTDRVWLTMSSALQIKLGCSLGGPAGTGKTETTKDLAKFFGIQCIVFNCSEQIDYKILGNIFSGLCKHKYGAFACLDEFNRINLEVLSVIATQLFTIRQAQLGDKKKVTILTESIDLVGKSGVFITMNPTYSGRSELPDNLKANFRPITMMKPEFSKIAQVKLYSEGFSESDVLSKKLFKLYDLAQQQLSQQDHYDFTLRTLGTVLSMAGNLKRNIKSQAGQEKRDEDKIILSSLEDANFPKFIAEDIKLFKALLSDLFPGVELDPPQTQFFEEQINQVMAADNIDPSPFTISKCQQLIDIMNIRLGICLTGPAGTGKTTVIKLVEKVSTQIRKKYNKIQKQIKAKKEQDLENERLNALNSKEDVTTEPKIKDEDIDYDYLKKFDPKYRKIKTWTINPKSITMGELFGEENEEKKIFEYGIATKKLKKALNQEREDKFRIVILDGPIDTKWIENMNSVLDDSQTLCLANGERIKLKSHVKVFFEVEDLSKASLATVSRLGVIYFGPTELGWRPYAHYWMKKYFKDESVLPNELQNYLNQLFEGKVDDVIDNMEDLYNTGCCFMKPTISSMIRSLCQLLEFYITKEHGFIGREMEGLNNQDQLGRYKKWIIMCFALAMVWGCFGCVNNKGCPRVESFIRNKFNEIKLESSQVVMENYYDFERHDYVKFSTENYPFKYTKAMPFSSIYVPTIDSLRYSFILETLLNLRGNVYVTGETGTGKTAIIQNIIKKLNDTEEWTFIRMNFSAQTSSKEIQSGLENKLEQEKGKKFLWGQGGKKCLIYIDDVNMPEPNEWGAHPPIELLRQYLDQGGWYDRPAFFWKHISNTNMIVAGGPPFGGRSLLTDRFTRHFTLICFPQPNKQVLGYIFENILKGFFTVNIFSEVVKKYTIETVTSTIELYEFMLTNMKPIPSKFHYIFNLRDISRIFQGILMIESRYFTTPESYIKLWLHEVERVFCDRLTNQQDLKEVRDMICSLLRNKFKTNYTYDQIYNKGPPIYYGEVHKGMIPNRPYEFITNHEVLYKKLNEFVSIYNSKNKTAPMDIVFFDYFVTHILRVCRVLRMPHGNMVLIGHGGSGKQTVCQLASFIMTGQSDRYTTFNAPRDFKLFEFKKVIKDIIKRSNYYPLVLLLNDNNVGHNFILENINNFLSNGEIPGLLETEYAMPMGSLQPSPDLTYDLFVENTKSNLHILFCTSPVGENLRMRMRKFPSLINCCILDWFMPWPLKALESCCKKSFNNLKYEEDIKTKLVKLVCEAHSSVENLRDDFMDELGRKVYITPKTFLDMNNILMTLLESKKSENQNKIDILEDGTKKIKKTQQDIVRLEDEIRKIEPEIADKEKYLEGYVKKIKVQKEEVQRQRVKVNEAHGKTKEKMAEVNELAKKIKGEANEVETYFKKIKKEVETKLNSDTLSMFAKEKATSDLKMIVPEALAFFLNGKHTKSDEKSYAFQVFQESKKIYDIKNNLDTITEPVIDEFKKYIYEKIPKVFEKYHPELQRIEDKLGKLSETHQTLYLWGKGAIQLWETDKKLKPLREELANKEATLKELQNNANKLKEEEEQALDMLNKLEEEKKASQENLDNLQEQKNLNTKRKNNASKLILLLKDENIRWNEQLVQLHNEENNFLGDIIISALFISYMAPFSGNYRKRALNTLLELCKKYNISYSPNYSLENIMSDAVEIRQWTMNGLPNDAVSIENAIMFTNNKKFPLFIDPQLQGNQWIKKLYKGCINIYKADCKEENLKAQLEGIGNDIIKGSLTLLENVTEVIDNVYAPIMNQAVFVDDSGLEKLNFNGNDREYNEAFKMIFTTKMSNPHYPPEYYIKLNIINFTVTESGLSEQLLSDVFKCERREKYEQRDKIIAEMGEMNDRMSKNSKEILTDLKETPEDKILDAEELIVKLETGKALSDEISVNMKSNIQIEKEINELRNEYVPIAERGSILYFVVASMSKIDPMYQFSLEYFKKIFITSIMYKQEGVKQTLLERVKFLVKKITEDIFKNIKRGIFEHHKTLFSFLIDINILKYNKIVTDDEFSLFVKGPSSSDNTEKPENPDKTFFSEFQWDSLLYFEEKFGYNNISSITKTNLNKIKIAFEQISDLKESFDSNIKPIFEKVEGFNKILERNFLKLLMIKIYKPERLLYFVREFVKNNLGELFIDTAPSRLEEVYEESDWKTPIIFILSKGADPTQDFLSFKNRYEKIRKERYEEELKRKEEEARIREQERLAELEREDNEDEEKEEKEDEEEKKDDRNEGKEKKSEEEQKSNKENENNNSNNNAEDNKSNPEDKNKSNKSQIEEGQAEEEKNAYEFKEYIISLGQGQEEEAKKAILEYGIKNGAWVLLQNCHLFTSFMPDLASIVQSLQQDYTDTLVDINAEKEEKPKDKKDKNSKDNNGKNKESEKDNKDNKDNTDTKDKNKTTQNNDTNKYHKKDNKAEKEKDPLDNLVNPNFRLWLTSMPVKTFPVSILQNSLKLTTEPPSGIKSNIKKLFNEITEEKTQPKSKPINTTDKKPEEIKAEQEKLEKDNIIKKQHFIKLLYSLSLFHAVLQERKKFGPIGFNLRYDFNQGDFDTSSELVNIYLSEAPVDEVPWDSIIYLIGEVTYGGSIVDETDRIVMNCTLGKFINDTLFDKLKDENGKELDQEIEFKFGDYMIPAYKTLLDYQKYITTLPNADDPQIFGLNDNANIVYQLKESDAFLGNLTSILPREVNKKAGGKTSNEIVLEIINNIFNEQIEAIDKKERNKAHDKIYDNELKHPLTIVLYQEIDKYNNLISKIETSLKELKGAIEGTSIMSYESDEIYNSLLINRIPLAWQKVGYSSFKSFISWKNDLQKRIEFIRDWLINGHPTTFWISGLFYPQGFITGVYQNHARETKIPVSDIVLEYQVMNKTKDEIKKGPDAGVYIYGLYLEGASWHEKLGLVDQKAGEMRCYMPVIWLKTVQEKKNNKEEDDDDEGEEEDEIYTYCCPMFKTGKRASIIASSGNSVEKIIDVDLPSRFKKEYWTLRGACLLTQIED